MAKILVSVDDALLTRIDRAARKHGLSRSAYLARAASKELGLGRGPGSAPAVRGAARRLDRIFAKVKVAEDPTDAIRAERDAR